MPGWQGVGRGRARCRSTRPGTLVAWRLGMAQIAFLATLAEPGGRRRCRRRPPPRRRPPVPVRPSSSSAGRRRPEAAVGTRAPVGRCGPSALPALSAQEDDAGESEELVPHGRRSEPCVVCGGSSGPSPSSPCCSSPGGRAAERRSPGLPGFANEAARTRRTVAGSRLDVFPVPHHDHTPPHTPHQPIGDFARSTVTVRWPGVLDPHHHLHRRSVRPLLADPGRPRDGAAGGREVRRCVVGRRS